MTDTLNNVHILMNGQEIEPNGIFDFSFRRITNEKMNRFRGLASQITVNPEDKQRIQTWYGDKLGHCEQTVMQSDFASPMYRAAFKNTSVDILSKKVKDETVTLDPDSYGIAYLKTADNIVIKLKTPKNTGTKFQIFTENLFRNTHISFSEDTPIKWIAGTAPTFPTDGGKTFCITFTWDGSWWLGGQDTTNPTQAQQDALCLNSTIMSLGYCLPAGSSSNGEIPEEYSAFSGIADFSDETLINIAQVVANIGNINDVANAKDHINIVEDNLPDVKSVAEKIEKIVAVNDNFAVINTVYQNLTNLSKITANLSMLTNIHSNLDKIEALLARYETAITQYEELLKKTKEEETPKENS